MRIIVEGPDGSGKSTLVSYLARELGLGIKKGEGPEKWPGEINERASRWLMSHFKSTDIFDRHPCISHPIYSRYNPSVSSLNPRLEQLIYVVPSFVIYCKGQGLSGHQRKSYDSDDHMARVEESYSLICQDYDNWALNRAHLLYDYTRVRPATILKAIKGILNG